MAVIAFVVAMYGIASVFEALDEVFAVIASAVSGEVRTLIIIAVTAFAAYRWYQARHAA